MYQFEFNLRFLRLHRVIGLFILVSCRCMEWCILGTASRHATLLGSLSLAQILFGLVHQQNVNTAKSCFLLSRLKISFCNSTSHLCPGVMG